MKTEIFDYDLPKELIAQTPLVKKDESRLLLVSREGRDIKEDKYKNLAEYLTPNDVLVFNDSKVIPAKLRGNLVIGDEKMRKMEVLLLRMVTNTEWECLVGGRKKFNNMEIEFEKGIKGACRKMENNWSIRFSVGGKKLSDFIEEHGKTPLPPYIKKDIELKKYQNVYARAQGSVAAPTAGFHFTKELLLKIKEKSVAIEYVTLHVGLGTFLPMKTENLEDHIIHKEYVMLTKSSVDFLNKAKVEGKRIVAVGTTSARVLEACCDENGKLKEFKGDVNIFIYPPYKFKFVDGLITNFHLPKSTLMALVSAYAGCDRIKKAYKYAIKNKFRFYSFGDGMFLY